MIYLVYLYYLLKHKYYVGIACFRFGLYWRGLKHDWTKFIYPEFIGYSAGFNRYLQKRKPTPEEKDQYSRSFLHHQHSHAHHWQHWVFHDNDGTYRPLEMPYKDALEMYCDWWGVGHSLPGRVSVREWYDKNKEKILLHPKTRDFIEKLIDDEEQKSRPSI